MRSGSSGERERSAMRAKRRHMMSNSHELVDNHDLIGHRIELTIRG